MKVLIVISNPNKASYTHAMADAYKTGSEKKGHEVKTLDLYEFDQDILKYENTDELKKGKCNGGKKMKQVQDMIAWSDEMAYFFPVWWGNIPAILKNFFDVNLSAGFAFEFIKGKNMPKKLLTDKTAKIFYHSDAPSFLYKLSFMSGINIKKYLKGLVLGFCGIKTTGGLAVGNLRGKNLEQRKAILEKIAG